MGVSRAYLACCSVALLAFLVWRHSYAPTTHHQVLGLEFESTATDIANAYHKKLSTLKNSRNEGNIIVYSSIHLQVLHAFAILSDPLRKRDYTHFHQDELRDDVKRLQRQVGSLLDLQQLPLWEPFDYEPSNLGVHLTVQNFSLSHERRDTWLIQIYSVASRKCWKHEMDWGRICGQMEGVAKVGRVELGEVKLATYFADRNWATGRHFFRHGLPAYAAIPPDCKSHKCIVRYEGSVTVDGVVDWMAAQILKLPRIMYYSPQTLVSELFQKSGLHKVKVVIFSTTGERADPILRKAVKQFSEYFAFGIVLWREEDATLWESMFGILSAPAILFLKDPGVPPTIFYGKLNSSVLHNLLQENKHHVLPQLRSITARELGCTEAGYSLAGKSEHTWYCVIVAGRPGLELSRARAVMRDVKDNLTKEASMHNHNTGHLSTAALALKAKRMDLAWLDGVTQKQFCLFYLNSETVHETCGAKAFPDQSDVPRLFIIRYRRHPKDLEKILAKKQGNFIWSKLFEEQEDLASQIVAVYKSTFTVEELISWMCKTIEEGDREDLLVYIKKAPLLVPEERKPAWLGNAQTYGFDMVKGLFTRGKSFGFGLLDLFEDPRFTPTMAMLLLFYLCSLFFISRNGNDRV